MVIAWSLCGSCTLNPVDLVASTVGKEESTLVSAMLLKRDQYVPSERTQEILAGDFSLKKPRTEACASIAAQGLILSPLLSKHNMSLLEKYTEEILPCGMRILILNPYLITATIG